jgi:hypothetical protein
MAQVYDNPDDVPDEGGFIVTPPPTPQQPAQR